LTAHLAALISPFDPRVFDKFSLVLAPTIVMQRPLWLSSNHNPESSSHGVLEVAQRALCSQVAAVCLAASIEILAAVL